MSRRPTEPIRAEHRDLAPHLQELDRVADELAEWSHETAAKRLHEILDFLEGHLLPHAAAEEEGLYPAIDRAMGVTNGTATMRVDHEDISARVRQLRVSVVEGLDVWPTGEHSAAIARQLSALSAIIMLHFRKEEEVLLPILDSAMSSEEVEALLAGMGHGHSHP